MRSRLPSLAVLALILASSCDSIGEHSKEPIALEKVPAEILAKAKEQLPDAEIYTAFTEVEDGQPVYEFRAKMKTGKIREVEITRDGKVLNME